MLKPLVVLSALVIGSASLAHADTINGSFSVFGSDSWTSSTISFSNSTVQPAFTGTFATYMHTGDPLTFLLTSLPYTLGLNTPPTNLYPSGVVPLFTVTDTATNTVFTFDMTSYDAAMSSGSASCPGSCLSLTAYGYITSNNPALTQSYNGASGTTTLQYSPGVAMGTLTTYSGQVVAPTPEPSSLALLGTGLLGAVGIARRKMRV